MSLPASDSVGQADTATICRSPTEDIPEKVLLLDATVTQAHYRPTAGPVLSLPEIGEMSETVSWC